MAAKPYTMSPFHPRWPEFVNRLAGPGACNWRDDGWECFRDFRFTRQILPTLKGEIDVEASIEFFRVQGAHCDCTVIMNLGDDDKQAWLAEKAVQHIMAEPDNAKWLAEFRQADAEGRSTYSQTEEFRAGKKALKDLDRLTRDPEAED
jgi:hypothetical protein